MAYGGLFVLTDWAESIPCLKEKSPAKNVPETIRMFFNFIHGGTGWFYIKTSPIRRRCFVHKI